MISSRWISLVAFILVLTLIIIFKKGSLKKKLLDVGIVFCEGMVGGLIIDSVLINAGLYNFPRQPIYSQNYWLVVLPCWGVFGVLINYTWNTIGKGRWLSGGIITMILVGSFYELSNLYTGSWIYTAPAWLVGIGWIPLTYVFAGCHRRREVQDKIREKEEDTEKARKEFFKSCYVTLRIFLTVVMFPLLIASLLRVFEMQKGRRLEYAKYLLEMA